MQSITVNDDWWWMYRVVYIKPPFWFTIDQGLFSANQFQLMADLILGAEMNIPKYYKIAFYSSYNIGTAKEIGLWHHG